jgi:hypothetical protein
MPSDAIHERIFIEDNIFFNMGNAISAFKGGLKIRNNYLLNAQSAGMGLIGVSDAFLEGNVIENTNLSGGNVDNAGLYLYNSSKIFLLGNVFKDTQATPTTPCAVRFIEPISDVFIQGNDFRGPFTVSVFSFYGAVTNLKVLNNPGYNPQSASTPTVPPSPATFGPYPYPVTIIVYGGTVSDISIRGLSTGLTSGTFYLYPGDTLTITYSVAPTVKIYPQ